MYISPTDQPTFSFLCLLIQSFVAAYRYMTSMLTWSPHWPPSPGIEPQTFCPTQHIVPHLGRLWCRLYKRLWCRLYIGRYDKQEATHFKDPDIGISMTHVQDELHMRFFFNRICFSFFLCMNLHWWPRIRNYVLHWWLDQMDMWIRWSSCSTMYVRQIWFCLI